jgi:hypothetical protein
LEDCELPNFLEREPLSVWTRTAACKKVSDRLAMHLDAKSTEKARLFRTRILEALKDERFSTVKLLCNSTADGRLDAAHVFDQLSRLMPAVSPATISVSLSAAAGQEVPLASENALVWLEVFAKKKIGAIKQMSQGMRLVDRVTALLLEWKQEVEVWVGLTHQPAANTTTTHLSAPETAQTATVYTTEVLLYLNSQSYRELEAKLEAIQAMEVTGMLGGPEVSEHNQAYFRVWEECRAEGGLTYKWLCKLMEHKMTRPIFVWLEPLRSRCHEFFTLKLVWDGNGPITTDMLSCVLKPKTLENIRLGYGAVKVDVLAEIYTPYRLQIRHAMDSRVYSDTQIYEDADKRVQHKLFADRMYSLNGYASAARVVVPGSYAAVVDHFTFFAEQGDALGGTRLEAHRKMAMNFLVAVRVEASEAFKRDRMRVPERFMQESSKALRILTSNLEQLVQLTALLGYAPELVGSSSRSDHTGESLGKPHELDALLIAVHCTQLKAVLCTHHRAVLAHNTRLCSAHNTLLAQNTSLCFAHTSLLCSAHNTSLCMAHTSLLCLHTPHCCACTHLTAVLAHTSER